VRALREKLPTGRTEDDVDGPSFASVHALFTLGHILRGQAVAGYDREPGEVFGEAFAELARVLRRNPWLDADGDGVVDAGETDAELGAYGGLVRSHVTASDWDDESFERFSVTGDR